MPASVKHKPRPATAWGEKAAELADWAVERLFVRTDAFGSYKSVDGKKAPTTCRWTGEHGEFRERLIPHFQATAREQVVGAHALSRVETEGDPCVGKWVGIDIDAHAETDSPAWNASYADRLYRALSALGFRPLLVTHGTGGYHCWVLFDQPVPGDVLFRFGRWLVRDAVHVETFPKRERSDMSKAGMAGGWLRLPGRHHTLDRFASVFNGSQWVDGAAAVTHVLSLTGDSPDLIPPEARTYAAVASTPRSGGGGGGGGGSSGPVERVDGKVPAGFRHQHLFGVSCCKAEAGVPEAEAVRLMDIYNRANCSPPLDAGEVKRMVQEAYEYTGPPEPVGDITITLPATGEGPMETETQEAAEGDVIDILEGRDVMDLLNDDEAPELESLSLLGEDGYFIRGACNLVSASPKEGKSTLVYQCVPHWVEAGETILWFTEEPELAWRARLKKMPLITERGKMRLIFAANQNVASLLARLERATETVIVADTIRGLGITPTNENDAGAMQNAIMPWINACRLKEQTFIPLHHERKDGGAFGRGVSGSHALTGAVDSIIQIRRKSQRPEDTQRVVSLSSRFVQKPELVYQMAGDGRLVLPAEEIEVGGDGPIGKLTEEFRADLLDLIPYDEPGWTSDDLVREGHCTKQSAVKVLKDWVGRGWLTSTGTGKKGDPFRYVRTEGVIPFPVSVSGNPTGLPENGNGNGIPPRADGNGNGKNGNGNGIVKE